MNIGFNESSLVCEWLGEFFLPRFTSRLRQNGHFSSYDYFLKHTETSQVLTDACSSHQLNEYLMYTDIIKYFDICNQFVSNLVYLMWLFNLFKPLFLTIFITLFLLPTVIFLFIYASSFYMFVSKHWNKLKVSKSVYICLYVRVYCLLFLNLKTRIAF
jgi:hypothetical protein